MAWEHGNLKTDTNTYYNITLFLSANIERNYWFRDGYHDNKIYGKDILNIYENNSGKNIPFGQMDILHVV